MSHLRFSAALLAAALVSHSTVGHALSAKECSAKYKAAKAAATLGGKSWNEFRKAECGGEDKAAKATSTAASQKPPQPKIKANAAAAVYPAAVAPKFAGEKPSLARIHTCAEQFKANKASNANGGLRWIQKGGGYWSECNKRLKGKV